MMEVEEPMGGIRPLCLALAVLIAAPAAAIAQGWGPDRAYVSVGSHHEGLDPAGFGRSRWNEFNPGLILAWEDRHLGLNYAAGGFVNSFGDLSPFLGVSRFWQVAEDLSVGPFAALSDYGRNSKFFETRLGSTGVVVLGGVQANYRNVFVQVQPTGRTGGGVGAVVAAGLTFSLR
jgi:hypothetical protein